MTLPGHPLPTTRVLTAIAGNQVLAFPSAATGLITACACTEPPPGAVAWLGGVAAWRGQVLWVLDPVGLCRGEPRPAERLVVVIDSGVGRAGWGMAISVPATLADATPIAGEVPASCPPGWLRPCLLQDGRRAWQVDTMAITAALHDTVAA